MFTVIYQAKSSSDGGVTYDYQWLVWKDNIPSRQVAEHIKLQAIRIFGRPAKIIKR